MASGFIGAFLQAMSFLSILKDFVTSTSIGRTQICWHSVMLKHLILLVFLSEHFWKLICSQLDKQYCFTIYSLCGRLCNNFPTLSSLKFWSCHPDFAPAGKLQLAEYGLLQWSVSAFNTFRLTMLNYEFSPENEIALVMGFKSIHITWFTNRSF